MRYLLIAVVLIVAASLGLFGTAFLATMLKNALGDWGEPSMLECLLVIFGGAVMGVAGALPLVKRLGFL